MLDTPPAVLKDRATAALVGLALGDALGMPTQSMSQERIRTTYGSIKGFRDAVADQPIAPNMPAGSVTDDTEQAVLLAKLLIEGHGSIESRRFATALEDWEAAMKAKGSLDLLGPSTKAAIALIQAGAGPEDDPGAHGTTNGAAMRISPVGIAFSLRAGRLADKVVEASRLTHNTGLGLGAAGAVAAAVSAALDQPGSNLETTVAAAVELAARLERQGNWIAGASVSARIGWAVDLVADASEEETCDRLYRLVGTSVASQESVPAAFAIASRFADQPFHALEVAAQIGGDTDTMAAIIGAILGAQQGMAAWPAEAVETVSRVNGLDMASLADGLLALRQGS